MSSHWLQPDSVHWTCQDNLSHESTYSVIGARITSQRLKHVVISDQASAPPHQRNINCPVRPPIIFQPDRHVHSPQAGTTSSITVFPYVFIPSITSLDASMAAKSQISATSRSLIDDSPNENQFIAKRGRSNSPPFSRAIFYDPVHCTTQIRRVKNDGESIPTPQRPIGAAESKAASSLPLSLNLSHRIYTKFQPRKTSDLRKYQKIKISASSRLVTIYVDHETETEPTADSVGSDGRSNPVLTRLHLDRAGLWSQILRRTHLLDTCYVRNAPTSSSESSSETKLPEVKCTA